MDPHSLFSLNDHLEALSQHGDPLEVLGETVDFEYFRSWLIKGLSCSAMAARAATRGLEILSGHVQDPDPAGTAQSVRCPHRVHDPGSMSWMRFLGFSLGDRTPDENTIRHFRNRMTETGTLQAAQGDETFDWQLHKKGYIPMSGQIVDASLVPRRRQRRW